MVDILQKEYVEGERKAPRDTLSNSANTEGMGRRHLEGKANKTGRKLGGNAAFEKLRKELV